jgi:hypothetical protein
MKTDIKAVIPFPLPKLTDMTRKATKGKGNQYLTLENYLSAVHKATGVKISMTTLLARRQAKEIEFTVYEEPVWKIDTKKFPPAKFEIKTRGRKSYKSK